MLGEAITDILREDARRAIESKLNPLTEPFVPRITPTLNPNAASFVSQRWSAPIAQQPIVLLGHKRNMDETNK